MKILVAGDSYCPSDAFRPAFADLSGRHDVTYVDVVDDPAWRPTTPSELTLKEYQGTPDQLVSAVAPDVEVLVIQGAPVTDAVFAAAPGLRLVCCARGGPVNVDLAAATERGIPVVTTPGKNADAVAELTIAFLVMVARRLPEAIRHVERGGVFGHENFEGSQWFGHDVAGHTLGLVGYGQVGRRVAARALAFEMRVLVFDPYVAPETIAAPGIEPVDLSTILGRSDFISVHARLTAENRGMLGATEFGAMRKGVCLVNTSRRELIDEAALIDGLASGRVFGAALDVATPSPSAGRHPLLAFPNVVIVPHIGGATWETLHHGAEMAVAEIERLLAGEPLRNAANPEVLPLRTEAGAR